MNGFAVKIEESSKELTAKERIAFKDMSNAKKLDLEVEAGTALIIAPEAYVVLAVHNEKSDNKDYYNYCIVDKNGTKYVTGSESFWSTFKGIWDDMHEYAPDEEFEVQVYKVESKNYKGKYFLTCSIV